MAKTKPTIRKIKPSGEMLRKWWKTTRAEKYTPPKDPKTFWSDLQQDGFAATEGAVKKNLQLICAGKAPLTQKEQYCLEKFLGSIPSEIKIALTGGAAIASAWIAEAKHLESEFKPYSSPLSFIRKLHGPLQTEAIAKGYRQLIEEFRDIERGRIPLHADVNGYFIHFTELINDGKETARVVAQVLPPSAREKVQKLQFPDRINAAIKQKILNIEYVICLDDRSSLEKAEVIAAINLYLAVSSKVFLFYKRTATALSEADVSRAIVLLENHRWVFTHGWDFDGNLHNPVQHLSDKDYKHYANIYEKAKSQSEPCPDVFKKQLSRQSPIPAIQTNRPERPA
jgi:hypothetical protein